MLAVFMSVLSLAACILPFSGCGKTVGKVHNKGVKSGAVRDLTEGISKNESASKAPDDEFKAAASSFAAELFKDNYSKDKTTLVSPLSVLTALALVQNGAQGDTLAQLEQALGGLDRDTLNAYMRAYCDFLTESDELKIANSVWTDSSAEAKRAFLQKAVDSYSGAAFLSAPERPENRREHKLVGQKEHRRHDSQDNRKGGPLCRYDACKRHSVRREVGNSV